MYLSEQKGGEWTGKASGDSSIKNVVTVNKRKEGNDNIGKERENTMEGEGEI